MGLFTKTNLNLNNKIEKSIEEVFSKTHIGRHFKQITPLVITKLCLNDHCTFLFSFFSTENVVQTCSSPNYALASKYLELWASALVVRWMTRWPKKREKKKVANMKLCIFCKFILFFFPPIFFLTHFPNSGFGNCEQVSSPPLFALTAFVCL